jgi:N-acetylmuramoyl-L-alanine amidase-like protein
LALVLAPSRLCCAVLLAALALPAGAQADTTARSSSARVDHARTFSAPLKPTHLALHWRARPNARVSVRLSRDGRRFGRARRVQLDEASELRGGRETWGAVMLARGVRAIRVRSDRALARLTVVWLRDRGASAPFAQSAAYPQPSVLRRADWAADESLRFDSSGNEVWPSAYYPVQKLIVHHTATQNNDPNPAATVRSIYYYHAVTQGWGDIGYNFLIDEAGRIYEGRHTIDYPPGANPTEENSAGEGVTAAHAAGYNSGTVGIALLGTLTSRDATPAARSALERLLAWEADRHAIDPQGASRYTNPVNGTQATFANIAGHRDVAATECPGGVFYATLPTIRSDVAAMLAPAPAKSFALSAAPTSLTVRRGASASSTITVTPSGGFTGSVALSVSGSPSKSTTTLTPSQVTLDSSGAARTSRLTVATTSSTSLGTYTLRVTGTGGGLSRTANVALKVTRK